MVNGQATYPNSIKAIAATHSVFNILNAIVFLPFAGKMAKLLNRVVKDKPQEIAHLTSLHIRILETPVLAIEQSRGEVLKMGVTCENMTKVLYHILSQENPDPEEVEKLFH